MVHLVITGSRDWTDTEFIWQALDDILMLNSIDKFYHGGARGADTIGRDWALSHNIRTYRFMAEWKKYGNSAGPMRNMKMLDSAIQSAEKYEDELQVVAFRLGKSRGTTHMVEYSKSAGVDVIIFDK